MRYRQVCFLCRRLDRAPKHPRPGIRRKRRLAAASRRAGEHAQTQLVFRLATSLVGVRQNHHGSTGSPAGSPSLSETFCGFYPPRLCKPDSCRQVTTRDILRRPQQKSVGKVWSARAIRKFSSANQTGKPVRRGQSGKSRRGLTNATASLAALVIEPPKVLPGLYRASNAADRPGNPPRAGSAGSDLSPDTSKRSVRIPAG